MPSVTFRPLDLSGPHDFLLMQKWESDPEIANPSIPIFTENGVHKLQTADEKWKLALEDTKGIEYHMILFNSIPVGYMSYQMDPPHLLHKVPGSSWLGITIGDKQVWGKGIGPLAMVKLEELSRSAGACRMELGVFEFNQRALKLYLKAGFKEFGRVPRLTHTFGRWWDDIRLEKSLT